MVHINNTTNVNKLRNELPGNLPMVSQIYIEKAPLLITISSTEIKKALKLHFEKSLAKLVLFESSFVPITGDNGQLPRSILLNFRT